MLAEFARGLQRTERPLRRGESNLDGRLWGGKLMMLMNKRAAVGCLAQRLWHISNTFRLAAVFCSRASYVSLAFLHVLEHLGGHPLELACGSSSLLEYSALGGDRFDEELADRDRHLDSTKG